MAGASKKAEREGRTLVFMDEAGCYLLAAAVLTYAPKGQTPLLRVPLRWDHLSVISAITPDGKLYVQMQEQAFKGEPIGPFLKHLLRQIAGPLLIIWPGLTAHRGQALKDFRRAGAARRIHVEQLPELCTRFDPHRGHLAVSEVRGDE